MMQASKASNFTQLLINHIILISEPIGKTFPWVLLDRWPFYYREFHMSSWTGAKEDDLRIAALQTHFRNSSKSFLLKKNDDFFKFPKCYFFPGLRDALLRSLTVDACVLPKCPFWKRVPYCVISRAQVRRLWWPFIMSCEVWCVFPNRKKISDVTLVGFKKIISERPPFHWWED